MSTSQEEINLLKVSFPPNTAPGIDEDSERCLQGGASRALTVAEAEEQRQTPSSDEVKTDKQHLVLVEHGSLEKVTNSAHII